MNPNSTKWLTVDKKKFSKKSITEETIKMASSRFRKMINPCMSMKEKQVAEKTKNLPIVY